MYVLYSYVFSYQKSELILENNGDDKDGGVKIVISLDNIQYIMIVIVAIFIACLLCCLLCIYYHKKSAINIQSQLKHLPPPLQRSGSFDIDDEDDTKQTIIKIKPHMSTAMISSLSPFQTLDEEASGITKAVANFESRSESKEPALALQRSSTKYAKKHSIYDGLQMLKSNGNNTEHKKSNSSLIVHHSSWNAADDFKKQFKSEKLLFSLAEEKSMRNTLDVDDDDMKQIVLETTADDSIIDKITQLENQSSLLVHHPSFSIDFQSIPEQKAVTSDGTSSMVVSALNNNYDDNKTNSYCASNASVTDIIATSVASVRTVTAKTSTTITFDNRQYIPHKQLPHIINDDNNDEDYKIQSVLRQQSTFSYHKHSSFILDILKKKRFSFPSVYKQNISTLSMEQQISQDVKYKHHMHGNVINKKGLRAKSDMQMFEYELDSDYKMKEEMSVFKRPSFTSRMNTIHKGISDFIQELRKKDSVSDDMVESESDEYKDEEKYMDNESEKTNVCRCVCTENTVSFVYLRNQWRM